MAVSHGFTVAGPTGRVWPVADRVGTPFPLLTRGHLPTNFGRWDPAAEVAGRPDRLSVSRNKMSGCGWASDDRNPVRRMAFGTETAAKAFRRRPPRVVRFPGHGPEVAPAGGATIAGGRRP